jgi:hypothetical protein
MSDAQQPNFFDPAKPRGTYQCPRCHGSNTDITSQTELFCYDCRNLTSHEEQELWFKYKNKWYKPLTLDEL